MTKLPYKTTFEIVSAFSAGAQFVLSEDGSAPVRHVARIVPIAGTNLSMRVVTKDGGYYDGFRLDGTHRHQADWRLVQVAPIRSSADAFDMKTFVKGGRDAVVSKTGEVVERYEFSTDGIFVLLRNPHTKISRISSNYRHDGTHKHDPARDLYFVPLAPPKRKMRLEVVKLDGGKFTARCLGLTGPLEVDKAKQIGDRIVTGRYPVRSGTTVHVVDFEVDA